MATPLLLSPSSCASPSPVPSPPPQLDQQQNGGRGSRTVLLSVGAVLLLLLCLDVSAEFGTSFYLGGAASSLRAARLQQQQQQQQHHQPPSPGGPTVAPPPPPAAAPCNASASSAPPTAPTAAAPSPPDPPRAAAITWDGSRFAGPIAHGANYKALMEGAAAASLARWEGIPNITTKPACTKGGWAQLTPGDWYATAEGEVVYEPHACRLRRLNAHEARRCLANRTLMFVGDSLSRYQYVSLAAFVSHGRYVQRYEDDGAPSLVWEKTWPDFATFYKNGSAALTHTDPDGAASASEVCDCHRANLDASTRENRLLTVNVTGGPAAPATVRVGLRTAMALRDTDVGELRSAIQQSLSILASDVARRGVIVGNLGHWMQLGRLEGTEVVQSAYAEAASLYEHAVANITAHHPDVVWVWKTTTAMRPPHPTPKARWQRLLDQMAGYHGWNTLDAGAITGVLRARGVQGAWHDPGNYLAFVYDQLNDVLLNGVC